MTKPRFALILRTLAYGLVGALVADWIGTPLPYMIGPLLVVAGLSLKGVSTAMVSGCRDGGVIVLMTGIGLGVTASAASAAASQLWFILFAGVATVVIGCLLAPLLARLAGIDQRTAFFCAVPGGAAEMALLGERHGALAAPIAMTQLLRVVMLVLVLPPAITASGFRGDGAPTEAIEAVPFVLPGLFLTLVLAVWMGLFLRWLGVASGTVVGPLIVGTAFALSGRAPSSMPPEIMMAAQVFTGSYLGAQFQPDVMRRLGRFLPVAALGVVLLSMMCGLLGFALHFANGEPAATMLLATAPGSVTEMSITAKALDLNTTIVTAYHVLRIVVIVVLTSPAFLIMRHLGLADLGAPGAILAIGKGKLGRR